MHSTGSTFRNPLAKSNRAQVTLTGAHFTCRLRPCIPRPNRHLSAKIPPYFASRHEGFSGGCALCLLASPLNSRSIAQTRSFPRVGRGFEPLLKPGNLRRRCLNSAYFASRAQAALPVFPKQPCPGDLAPPMFAVQRDHRGVTHYDAGEFFNQNEVECLLIDRAFHCTADPPLQRTEPARVEREIPKDFRLPGRGSEQGDCEFESKRLKPQSRCFQRPREPNFRHRRCGE